jgi:hypothetical protein
MLAIKNVQKQWKTITQTTGAATIQKRFTSQWLINVLPQAKLIVIIIPLIPISTSYQKIDQ